MGNGEKTAKLWEDTVVLALRDAQWQARLSQIGKDLISRNSESDDSGKKKRKVSLDAVKQLLESLSIGQAVPPGFIKLDGYAESALADLAMASSDARFFLVEVKSSRELIRDEWKPQKERKDPLKPGQVRAKAAHRALKKAVDDFNSSPAGIEDIGRVIQSMRCHQVAYWWVERKARIIGHILVEPYIAACVDAQISIDVENEECMRWPKGLVFELDKSTKGMGTITWKNAETMLQDEARLRWGLKADEDSKIGYKDELFGLKKEEFRQYVNWLVGECTEGGGYSQPINCVVLSSEGFLQVITETNQLAQLLEHLHPISKLGGPG